MNLTSIQFPFHLMENTSEPEVKTKNFTSGISKIYTPMPENSTLDLTSIPSHSTLNYNGLLLPLTTELKFMT